jgi:hypothetical protein
MTLTLPPGTLPQSVGTMYLTLSFMPFDKPMFDDDVELKPVKSGVWTQRYSCSDWGTTVWGERDTAAVVLDCPCLGE